MAIYRGPGGSGDAVNDASSETRLAVEARDAAIAAQAAAEAAQAAAETAETNAETAETNAETAETNAETAATNAASSASAASTSATNASNSASAASTSATNSSNSASAAATSATNASNSASAAATSATNASNSASAAATSATNAANSATAAQTAQAAAEAALDAFDDIYLGAKSSNPTVDNDGNALTTGDQYFNTVSNELRVWNGSSWQAASVIGGTVTSLTVTGATALNGGTTLGDASGDALTINSSAVSIPNGLNFDSNTLVIDATNNRVGVGTASPAYKLDVYGGTGIMANFIRDSAGQGTNFTANAGGNYLNFTSTSSGTAPKPAYILADTYSTSMTIGTTSANELVLNTNNTERMRITSTGNVGIGISSPDAKLRVDLNGGGLVSKFVSNTGSTYISVGAASTYQTQFGYNISSEYGFIQPIAASGVYDDLVICPSGGNLLIGTTTNTNSSKLVINGTGSETVSSIQYLLASQYDVGTAPNKIPLNQYLGSMAYQDSASVSVGSLYSSGNVGIGVTPSAWRSIVKPIQIGAAGAVWSFTDRNLTVVSNNVYQNSAASDIYLNNGTAQRYSQDTTGQHVWLNAPSGTAGNAITFTQAMTLDASGNLGIGTTTPSSYYANDLVVSATDQGGITIASTATTGENYLAFADSTSGADRYTGYIGYNHTANFMRFTTNGGVERMRIDSSGNVGIGTNSPAVKLDVNRGSEGEYLRAGGDDTGTNGRALRFTSSTGGGFIGAMHTLNAPSSGGTIAFATNSTERMRIDSNGDIQIGTTARVDSSKLTVRNTANGEAIVAYCTNASLTSTVLQVRSSRNTTNNSYYAINYYNEGAAASKFLVADSGNVTNTNNSYGGISDAKLKENIVDATPKLTDLCNVKVRNFNFIGSEEKQLGVIAQELETVFPAMVDESPDRDAEGNDLGTTTKQVKYSVFVPMLIKAIQEQQAIITDLKARIETLENK